MILKGMPRHFNPFSIYITHTNKELTFLKFKTELHSFEEMLKCRDHSSSNDVIKLTSSFSKAMRNESHDKRNISCFTCAGKGHPTQSVPTTTTKDEKYGAAIVKAPSTKENPVAINEEIL